MRLLLKAVFLVGLLAGVLSTGTEDATNTSLTLEAGADLPMLVMTLPDNVVGCYLETPNEGTIEFKPEDKSGDRYELRPATLLTQCEVTVKEVTKGDSGVWRLYSVSDVGTTKEQIFTVTVNDETDSQEPETSTETTFEVQYLDNQEYTTKLGDEVPISISLVGYRETDLCQVQKPDGQVFNFTNEGIDHNGLAILTSSTISCGITVSIDSEDVVGDWILIARESSMGSDGVERRQPFTIHVEETVNAIPNGIISAAAGTNFHIRLEQNTDKTSTCKLISPNGYDVTGVESDPDNEASCGFIVKNLKTTDGGEWRIVYGDKITYTAAVNLIIEEQTLATTETLKLIRNQPAQVILGDSNAVYCKLEDPSGYIAFEGFGQCQLNLTRVTSDHAGVWKMHVGLPGKVITETVQVAIEVTETEAKPTVAVTVEKIDYVVYMTCSVSTTSAPKACKFLNPAGDILLANEGVGEDRYSFHGAGTSQTSDGYHHECGLRITSAMTSDLGMWRCGVETEEDTYYGFLTVLCPWAMMDPAVAAAVVSEPTLFANRQSVAVLEGDEATLSCNIAAPIRYCYFRSQNGSVFPVGPETSSHNYVYTGAGFDAGECGIRFSSLGTRDAGRWSCHVGIEDLAEEEQKADITLTVHEKMSLRQTDHSDGSLVVEGHVYEGHSLDYCRFVRMDGYGFTSASIVSGHHQSITDLSSLSAGICSIRIAAATILDHHPWTVAAKISGHDDEIFGSTDHTLAIFVPEAEAEHDHGEDSGNIIIYYRNNSGFFFFAFILPLALAMIAVTLLFGPKKNRLWTYERASFVRNSFRRSFSMEKKPMPDPAVIAA